MSIKDIYIQDIYVFNCNKKFNIAENIHRLYLQSGFFWHIIALISISIAKTILCSNLSGAESSWIYLKTFT